jgi:hypothetical protein
MEYQVFKQQAGASNDLGAVMEPGWYMVRMRPAGDPNNEPIPDGPVIGPYPTKGAALRALRHGAA